jgi:hypothetical protein
MIPSADYLFPMCPVDYLFVFVVKVITRVNWMTGDIDGIKTTIHMTKKMHSTFTPFIDN